VRSQAQRYDISLFLISMATTMTNDPIGIIKKDHKTVEGLFEEYEALGDGAIATKRKVVDQIIEELSTHAEMEETYCYPRFKEVFNKEDDKMVEEAYVEHAGAKKLLSDLKSLQPEQPEFDATVQVLMEQIRHHVKEEENDLLPEVEKEMPEIELETMGEEMAAFKESRAGSQ
jgi:hemerythrin-like domain-containing protein